jgi:hypothetical protein
MNAQKHLGGALSHGTKSTVLFTMTLECSLVARAEQVRKKTYFEDPICASIACLHLLASSARK